MAEFLKIAQLDENSVAKIQNLEKFLGSHIMAYEPGLDIADLTEAQMQALWALEKELGFILVAYEQIDK